MIKGFILILFILTVWLLAFPYLFCKFILIPYRRDTKRLPLNELLTLLEFYIKNEIELYETSIFNGLTSGIYTNAQFENFYKDIANRTIDALPSDFIKQFDGLITEEYIVSIIARQTKIYLQDKIVDVSSGVSYINKVKENNPE
jgi:hypothetical protein